MSDLLPPRKTVLTFNPEAYLVLEEAAKFPTQSLTICCWLAWVPPQYQDPAFASYATGPGSATIMNYDEPSDGSSNERRFWITNPSNVVVWWSGSSTGDTGIDVSDGNWFHLAVTMTPQDDRNYIVQVIKNGGEPVQRIINHDEGITLESNGPLVLGQRYWGANSDMFIGQFSELSVWDHVRSLADIRQDLTQSLRGNEKGLVLYWPLDTTPPGVNSGNLKFVASGGDDFGFNF